MGDNPATMDIQCPQCQARYRLEEKQLGGQAQVRVRCKKCQTMFTVEASAGPAAGAPAAVASGKPEATMKSKAGSRLPEGKVVALSVTQGPLKGKIFHVTKPRVVLGRSEADILVNDPEVSRKHCALEVRGSTVLLVDLGSVNGTFVDDRKVETCELEHLGEFRIGATTLMFTVTDEKLL